MNKHELFAVHMYDLMADAVSAEVLYHQARYEAYKNKMNQNHVVDLQVKLRRAKADLIAMVGKERLEEIRAADAESGFILVSEGWK